MPTIAERRRALTRRMIGPKVPRLWCPPLTHYTPTPSGDADSGVRIDTERMTAHWRAMAPHVGGFLVPGSTGDAWEMDAGEITAVLDTALDLAAAVGTRILVGALRADAAATRSVIDATVSRLQARSGQSDPLAALEACHVAGFTICPPHGATLSQARIGAALTSLLETGLPFALYQLPQVTGNRIGPDLFWDLSRRHPNLLLFKDSGGRDRVACADRGSSGVFLMRGAEGAYAQALREGGGTYNGLLLSTANAFAGPLAEIIALLEAGRKEEAVALSRRLTDVVAAAFRAVEGVGAGNAFANANKAFDHFMAYGPDALAVAPPLLHAGIRLPRAVVETVGQELQAGGLMPEVGYLEG